MNDRYAIVIVGSDPWVQSLDDALAPGNFRTVRYIDLSRYIDRLVDDRAALILVDAALPDAALWATLPKTSPATRRIPILVLTADGASADIPAADQHLALTAFLADALNIVRKTARLPTEADINRLAAQCDEPLPAEAQLAIDKFNAGEYYEQHDRFEHLWMVEAGPVRDLYRAILQVGVAYFQVTRGNLRGARKMLLRSRPWLEQLPDVCQGVDLAQLRRDADAVRAEIDRVGDDGAAAFDRSLLKGVIQVNTP